MMQLSSSVPSPSRRLCHLLHHVGELRDVERGDRGDLPDLLRLVVVVGLGVMLVVEPKFRIGNAVGRRADVGADASRVGLERQHVQVAHHLHVLAAFVALGNLDLDGRRIGGVAFAGADAGLLQRGFFLAILDGGDAAFHRAHAVQVFIQFVLVGLRQCTPQVSARRRGPDPASADPAGPPGVDARPAPGPCLSEEPVQHVARIDLGGDGLRRRAKAAVRIIALVQPFLVFLLRLRHRGQFQRRQRREGAHVVGGDLVRGNRDVDLDSACPRPATSP